MLTITKEFHFSASHVLDVLPAWHPCARMHGHNYIVVLELSARREDLNEAGFVRDYRDLDAFKKWMDDTLDHRHLNEAMGGGVSPSAENLAVWIFSLWTDQLPELTAVRVSETPKTWATYRPRVHREPDPYTGG
ncbi:6-pyruvoyl trahydropterin synthase family protein [Streptomyces sp. NRRL WC-3742]|uniref:6-pyruvoyl trahydropterin synthase family protein n=1 Tax=Streptomyces sp. NRRL WC-3742 TaxID=1463934 RepID=UPI00068B1AAE|nr:6-carboxytetrahydropterin synthase [Streptomyces sp. NRRL WC-3742]